MLKELFLIIAFDGKKEIVCGVFNTLYDSSEMADTFSKSEEFKNMKFYVKSFKVDKFDLGNTVYTSPFVPLTN